MAPSFAFQLCPPGCVQISWGFSDVVVRAVGWLWCLRWLRFFIGVAALFRHRIVSRPFLMFLCVFVCCFFEGSRSGVVAYGSPPKQFCFQLCFPALLPSVAPQYLSGVRVAPQVILPSSFALQLYPPALRPNSCVGRP